MGTYTISKELMGRLQEYLSYRPLREVAPLFNELQMVVENQTPKQDEICQTTKEGNLPDKSK